MFFKIKKTTLIAKLQTAYASKIGTEVGTMRYVAHPIEYFGMSVY